MAEHPATASPSSLACHIWPDRWQEPPHIELFNDWLVRLARRDIRRLMLFVPPQHGKSQLVSHFFPPWYLSRFPEHQVILASYSYSFASKWGRAARDVMRHNAGILGTGVREDVRSVDYWETTAGGSMSTAGIGGAITGRRADLFIIDDPIKSAEEAVSEVYRDRLWDWWQTSASTRLAPDGICVLIQTRWHRDDLAGRLLEEEPDKWTVISLPALAESGDLLGREPGEPLWPERYDKPWLQAAAAGKSSYWWEALYQQRPTQHEAVTWPRELFEGNDVWFDAWPQLQKRVMALDPSKGTGTKTGDYSAYTMLGIDSRCRLWVESDMSNTRGAKQLVDDGVQLYKRFGPDLFGVEANAFQHLLGPLFGDAFAKADMGWIEPQLIENRVNKEMRIAGLDEWFRKRLVHFRRTPGTRRLVAQLQEFPMGRHDDGPDSMEMAVRLLSMLLGVQWERQVGSVA